VKLEPGRAVKRWHERNGPVPSLTDLLRVFDDTSAPEQLRAAALGCVAASGISDMQVKKQAREEKVAAQREARQKVQWEIHGSDLQRMSARAYIFDKGARGYKRDWDAALKTMRDHISESKPLSEDEYSAAHARAFQAENSWVSEMSTRDYLAEKACTFAEKHGLYSHWVVNVIHRSGEEYTFGGEVLSSSRCTPRRNVMTVCTDLVGSPVRHFHAPVDARADDKVKPAERGDQ